MSYGRKKRSKSQTGEESVRLTSVPTNRICLMAERHTQTCRQTMQKPGTNLETAHCANTDEGLSLLSHTCEPSVRQKFTHCLLSSASLPCPHFHDGTTYYELAQLACGAYTRLSPGLCARHRHRGCERERKHEKTDSSPVFIKRTKPTKNKRRQTDESLSAATQPLCEPQVYPFPLYQEHMKREIIILTLQAVLGGENAHDRQCSLPLVRR